MVPLTSMWLPILLSAVIVFVGIYPKFLIDTITPSLNQIMHVFGTAGIHP